MYDGDRHDRERIAQLKTLATHPSGLLRLPRATNCYARRITAPRC
jgi:hypothetical protein